MPSHLALVKQAGAERGYHVRSHVFLEAPHVAAYVTRLYGVWGQADALSGPSGWVLRAEVAMIRGADDAVAALALAHELGHCEQAEYAGWTNTHADYKVARAEHEADAWERGLALWGALGLALDDDLADFALACLYSYGVTDAPVCRYLESFLGGDV